MPEVEYLTASDILALVELFFARLGYAPPLLRANGRELLESAVHRARSAAHYVGADLSLQAATLANGLARNHPFVDGNKRAAWIGLVAFLALNGQPLPMELFERLAEELIRQLEDTDRSESDELLADWLRRHIDPSSTPGG
jgi:death-on-curing protein